METLWEKMNLFEYQYKTTHKNHIKLRIDKMQQNSRCWLRNDRDEMINPIFSECSKLAQKDFKIWHD